MIVFDLACQPGGHRFEGWFASSDDFARQQGSGLLACPRCGSAAVVKAPMAPALPRKGNRSPTAESAPERARTTGEECPPPAAALIRKLAALQAEALRQSRWVGDSFAEVSRAIHYGEREAEPVHGKATAREARDLIEEGVPVLPLLIPAAPPERLN